MKKKKVRFRELVTNEIFNKFCQVEWITEMVALIFFVYDSIGIWALYPTTRFIRELLLSFFEMNNKA